MSRAGEGSMRADYGSSIKKKIFLIPSHPLTNLEIQKRLSEWTYNHGQNIWKKIEISSKTG